MTTEFSARQAPWTTVGTVLDGDVSVPEALQLANMNWNVVLQKAGHVSPRSDTWVEDKGQRALVREDNGAFFSFCSTEYRPVQFGEAFDFLQEINPRIVSAGTRKGGKMGFMVAQIPEHDVAHVATVAGVDEHELYVIVRTTHDRTRALEVALTTLRGKCMNQMSLPSLTAGAPQRWSIRHVGDPLQKLEQAYRVMYNLDAYTAEFERQVGALAEIKVDEQRARTLLKQVIPGSQTSREEKVIPGIVRMFTEDPTETNGYAGTGWGLVNAVNEFYEWGRPRKGGRSNESQFIDSIEGLTYKTTARMASRLLANA